LVVAPPDAATAAPSTSSWVAALGDCLEERAAGQFHVVDRVAPGETVRSARDRIADVRDMKPSVVVVGLGARELGADKPDGNRFRKELTKLTQQLRSAESSPTVVLVGMVAPTVVDDPKIQLDIDKLATAWNLSLEEMAAGDEHIRHVDLWASWPKDGAQRTALTVDAWELSDQGHARVAAAVCESVSPE
jgi:lysophospholipase L1-like esterase